MRNQEGLNLTRLAQVAVYQQAVKTSALLLALGLLKLTLEMRVNLFIRRLKSNLVNIRHNLQQVFPKGIPSEELAANFISLPQY